MPTELDKLLQQRRKRRLKEIEPEKVDLVDRAANKWKFLIFKEDTMSQGSAVPELASVGNEPVSPEAASELERAAAALDGMTQQVEGLMADLKKEQAQPVISLEAEEGITAATTLQEVSTRSANLAKALEDAQQPDMGKLAQEAGALVEMLSGIAKTETEPEPTKPTEPATIDFKTVAETSLSAAATLAGTTELTDEARADIDNVAKSLGELAAALQVEETKLDPTLPEAFTADQTEDAEIIKAMEGICRDVTSRINTVSKLAGETEVSEATKKEVSLLHAMVVKATVSIPTKTVKSAQHLIATLKDVAGRTLELTARAEKTEDQALVKEIQDVNALVEGLVKKYENADVEFEMSDLGQILSADRLLQAFDAQVGKLETPVEPAPAEPVEPVVDDSVTQLSAQVATLSEQLKTIQASVAKARGVVAEPAAAAQDPDVAPPADNADLLYPRDYNSPEYRDKLAKRGIK